MATQSKPRLSWKSASFFALRAILALAFVGFAVFKFSGQPAAVDEFARVGLGQWLRYFTATCELTGALLLLWPRTIALGSLLMGVVCVGAFFAQFLFLHRDVVHPIVLTAILWGITWVHRSQIHNLVRTPAGSN